MIVGQAVGEDYPCGDGEPSPAPASSPLTAAVSEKADECSGVTSLVLSASADAPDASVSAHPQIAELSGAKIVIAEAVNALAAGRVILVGECAEAAPLLLPATATYQVMQYAQMNIVVSADTAIHHAAFVRGGWANSRVARQAVAVPTLYADDARSIVAVPLADAAGAAKAVEGLWTLATLPVWVVYIADPGGGGSGGGPGGEQPGGGWQIFVRRVYVVSADVELKRVSDNIRIPVSSIQVSLDWDKPHWEFSATILGQAALDAVMPSSDGQPVMLEASINGYQWHVLVEDWGVEMTGRSRQRTITGKSLSSLLAAPVELPVDRLSTELATAQQLAFGALPAGWQLVWEAADWLIPAGAWSATQLTPIQVVKAFASAIRASVVPSRTAQSLTVRPRYPIAPWAFSTSTPNIIVPGTAATQVTLRQSIPAQGNAVFVQGGAVGGVLVKATRAGTAGDRLLATVQDNLITHVDAARARAAGVLAAQCQQPTVRGFTMPIRHGAFPLVELGDLLRVELSREQITGLGIANSVSVSATRQQGQMRVRQRVTLGEDTPNLWAMWNRNQAASPLMAGIVDAVVGDGALRIALVNGAHSVVRGSASVGDYVYIRDGRLDGPAGTQVSAIEIEV